jgi:hypothetical protein
VQDSLKAFKKLEDDWKEGLKKTEFSFVKEIIETNNYELLVSKSPRKNWIRETLLIEKQLSKFKSCSTLVMVGSGMYPYSVVDTYNRYQNLKIIGLDYDDRCVKISNHLLEKCNLQDYIKVIHINGIEYDYSSLSHEDLVFLSIDVVGIDEIYNKVVETSKAQPYVCAPGKHAWFKNTFGSYLRR